METDQYTAVGMLLDLVSAKLDGSDRVPFDQLVAALVQTGQLDCARLLDEKLTEKCLQDGCPKLGQQNLNIIYMSCIIIS